MPKVSSPARRPHAFNWSSPPWSARGRRTELLSAQAQRQRGKEGAPWRARDQVIAALPRPPRLARLGSRQLTGSRSDGDYPPDARPITPSRAAHPGRGRKWPARCEHPCGGSGGAGAGCGRLRLQEAAAPLRSCPPWSGARGESGAPGPPDLGASGGGPAHHRGPGVRTQTLGPGPGSRCGLPSTRPTRCAGGRSEPRASGVPPPPPPWAPEGPLRAESHSGAEARGTPSRRLAGSLGWSASSAGNSRQGRPPPRRRVGRRVGGRQSTFGTARPPAASSGAPRWGQAPGAQGSAARSEPPPLPRALGSQTLPPPSRHPSPPSPSSVSPLFSSLRNPTWLRFGWEILRGRAKQLQLGSAQSHPSPERKHHRPVRRPRCTKRG